MKITIACGARPNFVKVAPILSALAKRGCASSLVHTGQHNSELMSESLFRQLGIAPPDVNLNIGPASPAVCIARILTGLEGYLDDTRPDWVVVVGDVTSTLACALLARTKRLRVAHVEAGLRSFDDSMPEETNRRVTDAVSELLLASEESAVHNLRKEGIPSTKIHLVGNVMIDTLRHTEPQWRQSTILETLGIDPGGYHVLTLHRPVNVDDATSIGDILAGMREVALETPVVFPVHPRTEHQLRRHDIDLGAVRTCPALPYLDFIKLVASADAVWTDSGGLQEEACALNVPCLTLRTATERPSTLLAGGNLLVAPSREGIRKAFAAFQRHRHCRNFLPEGWDGHAAERVVDALLAA